MNKNYIAVFQKAENLLTKITLFLLIVSAYSVHSYGQSAPYAKHSALSYSHKGPFDINESEALDASPPVITYTPLTSTCATGNRTLTATITDAADGVPTSGAGLPVLYWQINSGAFTPAPASWGGGNVYNFTFGIGAVPGNLVSYYIVAQDNAGNVIAKPSAGAGGYTTSPPKAATDPTTPDFYVIQTTLTAGTYEVGVGKPFLTITDAVNAYNNSCLSGAIIFHLSDGSYSTSEVFPITINNPQANATNTLTIKADTGISPIIQGSSPDAIFKLNGADFITIDGSNIFGGITKNLTIENTSTNLTSAVIWVGSASVSNAATSNTIKNCIIAGHSATTTYAGIIQSSGVIAGQAAEAANSNNTYRNNSIHTSYYGMIVMGPAANESNTIIKSNIIGNTLSTKKLGYRGLWISNETNMSVDSNTVYGINSSLGLGSDTDPTSGIAVGGIISGGSVTSNTINDIQNTNAGGWPAYGIALLSTSPAANLKIYNNMIHGIVAKGNPTTPGYNGCGIGVLTGGGYGIYYNSVNLTVNQALGGISASIFIGASITGTASLDIRDNIFSNRRTNGTQYAIYCSVPNIVFSNINYNDYFATSFVGFLGSNRANIAAWQVATGFDGNSTTVNPIFVSATDLHLNPISPLNDQGQVIAAVTTDIDNATRSVTATDIGADEFTPPNCTGNNGGTATSDFITVCSSGSVQLSASGFSYGLGILYLWQSSTDNFASNVVDLTSETNPTSANPPVITATTWYRLRVICTLIGGVPGYSNAVKITVYDPHILTTTPGSRCGPGTVDLAATGTPTTAIQWYTAITGGAPVYTGSPFTTPSISTTTTYYAESVYLGSSGSVGPVSPTAQGGTISTQLTSWDVTFNVIQATKLLTIDIYPLATGENFTIDVYNSAGSVIATRGPFTTTVSGGATVQTLSMDVSLPIGNGYSLYATAGIPLTGLTRNISNAVYPYNSTDIVITGNGFDQTFFMCYYNWRFSNGCSSSPRTGVTATIGASSAINVTATPAAICAGNSTTLGVTSPNTSYVYTWTPGPLVGASQTVSPSTTTTYTVNATDGTCTATSTVTVTVNPSSSSVNIAPSSVVRCPSDIPQLLSAVGGDIIGIPILTEGFNGAAIPSGWTSVTNWTTPTPSNSTGTVANSAWTLRPNNYSWAGNTFRSNDLSQFYLSNSDANSGVTRTALISPAFSLVGYTSATLNIWQFFASSGDLTDSICVEISQNGTTWTNIYSRHFGVGSSGINWANTNIPLNAYVGMATNYIRFRNYGTDDYWWALDNVSITGSNSGAPITWVPIAGLFTDAAGNNAYLGGPAATVYANPAITTTYTATATPVNACATSQTIDVTVRPLSATMSASPSATCTGDPSVISVTLDGTGPWDLTYSNGTPVTVNNIATSPFTFTVSPVTTTTYSITSLSDAFCTTTSGLPSQIITVSTPTNSVWRGISTDWSDPANWCGGVPTSTKDVFIPVTPNSPVITVATAVADDIDLSAGATLTINSGGKLSFKGNFINNGGIINNGTIVLNGTTAQSFPSGTSGTITAMEDIEVNNTAGVTFNRSFTIWNTLKPTAGTIILSNDTITLHSDASATASVSALGASAGFTYNGTGKFRIERYISTATVTDVGWRFLSAPLRSDATQTINQAWQEGQLFPTYTSTGYGMQIVGPGGTAVGFDINNGITSLKTYAPATNMWVTVPGTNIPIARTEGYMTFIRGDRGSNTFGSASATTLRMAGPINTGTTAPISTPTANGFISVGNPYPSAIDFAATTRNGLQNTYYVWDPQLGTYGGYQTFTFNNPGYSVTPGNGSFISGNTSIESGQAFFVVATSLAEPHNISFTESAKVAGSYQVQRFASMGKQLRTQLYSVSNGVTSLTDGTLAEFDVANSNAVDDMDAPKLSNFGENICILNSGKSITVERRAEIVDTDTIFYQLGQLRQTGYQLEFIAQDLAAPGLTAYLEDSYLHTTTVINLGTTSIIDFVVNADPASKASDRFRLVFKLLGPVPVTFTSITGYRQDKNIVVDWKVENELNIDHYEIERSVKGDNFIKMGAHVATGNNGNGTALYQWVDVNPVTGDNFYRIKSVGIGNDIKYSEIVKVSMEAEPWMITIYPNPVRDHMIGISFNNLPQGDYDIRLFNLSGQLVLQERMTHPGGSQRKKIPVEAGIAKGVYNLEIIFPKGKGKKRVYKVVID